MEKSGHFRPLYFISDELYFPPVENANIDGLLAVGGDLSPERLILAYKSGIFPWFNENSVILWWCPDPRMVLYPKKIKISKSMRKVMGSNLFRLTKDTCFETVIENCAKIPRLGQEGTWITPQMKNAYLALHKTGIAHSYEVWKENKLVGGLYGIDLGHVFCGESMFSLTSNASKFALIKLAQELDSKNYALIDCQVYTEHLASLGAEEISRSSFLRQLKCIDQ
ncbi:leucyl/phenylalanyl-tRNA--protein transferase [Maribacter algicola]|uniref:Leucyl/phenylalanyl-tRNA--protein transferase n=1 Tax=Meishania litoralis TaxID=3434685 RepID=A0ACC7LIK3_9FLAO